MLMIHTQEVTAEFGGFPLSVSVEPDVPDAHTKTIVLHAGQRDDGACEQWLRITGNTPDMRRVLREALDMIEEPA